ARRADADDTEDQDETENRDRPPIVHRAPPQKRDPDEEAEPQLDDLELAELEERAEPRNAPDRLLHQRFPGRECSTGRSASATKWLTSSASAGSLASTADVRSTR